MNDDNRIHILDIGAANGFNRDGWGDVRITGFEPDERSYNDPSFEASGDRIIPVALGAESGPRTFYLTRKKEVSSFLKPNREYVDLFPNSERWDVINQTTLHVELLDNLIDQLNDVDFIKLDTQGTELEILQGGINVLDNVLAIELEVEFVPIYQDQPLFSEILTFLNLMGFEFYEFVTEYRYNRLKLDRTGQLAFADALFMRTPESIIKKFGAGSIKAQKYKHIARRYGKLDLIQIIDIQSQKPDRL